MARSDEHAGCAAEVGRANVQAVHDAAVLAGEAGYVDPASGLFVFTSAYLAGRGSCCASGCRHCPYHDCSEERRR